MSKRHIPVTSSQRSSPTALEDESIWARHWVCVGVEQQIPAPNDLLPATVGSYGLHVQRQTNGSLSAAFNVLQQGSCWTIPPQCGNGSKIRCPYISCAHSLDTDALSAESGESTRDMRQFIGFNRNKLVSIPLAQLGPLIFLSLRPNDPPSIDGQLGDLAGAVGKIQFDEFEYVGRFWAELDCSWMLTSDVLFATLGAPSSTQMSQEANPVALLEGNEGVFTALPRVGPERLQLSRAFPNVVIIEAPRHVACVVIKPVRADRVAVVVALFAGSGATTPGCEEAVVELLDRWKSLFLEARAQSRMISDDGGEFSPIAAIAREQLARSALA